MEIIIYILLAGLIILIVALAFLLMRAKQSSHALELGSSEYRFRYEEINKSYHLLLEESQLLKAELSQTSNLLAAREQKILDLEAQSLIRDKDREQFIHAAKQSVSEMANTVSNKLIADHKQENLTIRQHSEAEVKKITLGMMQNIESLNHKLSSLSTVTEQANSSVKLLERALSSPGMAGQASQTALGNILSQMGLTKGTDYILEYSFDTNQGGRLRPDAIVFLPGGALLVIDSKSSKFLIDLAKAEGEEVGAQDQIQKSFLASMNKHLKDLSHKDYASWIEESVQKARINQEKITQTITLMWLPNEGALEKLQAIDATFVEKASLAGIFPVATNGLWTAIGVAQNAIRMQKREENLHHIVDEVKILLNRLRPMLEYATKLGTALSSSVKHFDSFAKSLNSSVIPSAKRLINLGVPSPAKGLPEALKVIAFDGHGNQEIEGNAQEIEEDTEESFEAITKKG